MVSQLLFCCCEKATITKATHRGKCLFGLTDPETGVHLGGKAWQQKQEAKSSCLSHDHKAQRTDWKILISKPV